ncbi:MAG TPA: MmgE/PrpD family protein [Stellaceae bacterium]|nr:MmgE/PrpD family protein [Stellaceae bacterium]
MTASRVLAAYAARARWQDLPQAVRHEAARALVNWIGLPIWGARDAAVERTLAALDPFSGPREAALFGRAQRIDPLKAALVNGVAASIADYDDTHLETVIHPTGPAACALFALVERVPMSGAEFLHALALGIEAQCRLAQALAAPPARMNGGWYLTGLCGGVGAAVAAGRALGLDEDRMLWATGIAAARAAGARETHGSMAKSLVAAFAGEEGLTAALLAQRGMEAPEEPIEGRRGLGGLVSEGAHYAAITDGLGRRFEVLRNAYKPFPSGIVIHAPLTGALELAREHRPEPAAIAAVRLAVHPLCLELCGRRAPRSAAEGTFSVYHWVAVALAERAIGIRHYSDAVVRDPRIVALRDRVEAQADPALRKDEARVELVLRDGTTRARHVAHALGTIERPLSDAELTAKLTDLVSGVLPPERADALARTCWGLAEAPDARALVAAAAVA